MNAKSDSAPSQLRYSRLRAWMARRYWKRKAKSIGDEVTPNPAVQTFYTHYALDAAGYREPLAELCQNLGHTDISVNAPSSDAQLRQRLTRELAKPAIAALLGTPDGTIGGFAWGHVGNLTQALANFRKAPALSKLSEDSWHRAEAAIAHRIGRNGDILAVYSIGLASRWRHGLAPVKHLLRPLFELGLRTEAHRAVWWAPVGSPVHQMALGFGTDVVSEVEGIAFFVHPDIRPLAKVFAALAAGSIADGLTKILPSRLAPMPLPGQGMGSMQRALR